MRVSAIALPLSACLLLGCGTPRLTGAPPVAVTVVVDYGGVERPVLIEQTMLPAGASPIEALADVVEVDQRFVSRTAADVWSVDGVATDVEAGMFWSWRLNGRRSKVAPDRYALRNGDLVKWTYVQRDRPDVR